MKAAALATVALAVLSGCAAPDATKRSGREALPFIEGDYARAVSEAKARNLPIFADVWTPW